VFALHAVWMSVWQAALVDCAHASHVASAGVGVDAQTVVLHSVLQLAGLHTHVM